MNPKVDFRILVKNDVENFDLSGEYLGVFAVFRVNLGGLGASKNFEADVIQFFAMLYLKIFL